MIDEEDDEEILKKGITFKSVLKNLISILFIILGAVFIYSGTGDQITSWSVGFMMICFGATLIQWQKSQVEPVRQTLTILICSLCGITKVRNYERGDFVYRQMGTCGECDKPMEIKQIYSVRLKKPTEPNKKDVDKNKEIKLDVK
ncbi:MAG: hypothetical protein ACW98X_24955 [Promethearchaeota archaeon]|jgi:hypothetical protein